MSNNFRKPNSLLDQEKHVVEYTSGQFIIAICIALVVALCCFLAGMFVKSTSQNQLASTTPAADTTKAVETPKKPVPSEATKDATPKKEGKQTSPGPNVLNNVKPNVPKPPSSEDAPRPVNLPPLSPTAAQKSAPDAPLQKNPTEPAKPSAPTPAPAPSAPAPAASAPAPAPSAPASAASAPGAAPPAQIAKAAESPKKEVASAPPNNAQSTPILAKEGMPAPKAPAKAPTAPTAGAAEKSSGSGFTIQLAAFAVAEASKAEDYKASLAKNTGLKPEIVKSKDGKYIRVVTGAFADRASADKAREELAKKGEFGKCFVRVRE